MNTSIQGVEEESVKDDELTLKATPTPDIFNQFDDCFLVTLSMKGRIYYTAIPYLKLKSPNNLIYWHCWKQNCNSWPFIRVCFVASTELSLSSFNSYNSININIPIL